MIIPQCSLNTFAAWKARLNGVPVPGVPVPGVPVPGVPVPGCRVCPAPGRDPSSNAGGPAAFDRSQARSCRTRLLATLPSRIIPGSAPTAQFYPAFWWYAKFLHQVPQLQQGDGRNHPSLGKKKREESWENSPECRTSPTWTMGCPGPCPCPAARSAARAGSPARPPTGGNWQSSVAPNYTSWVPGPLTPRSQSERLFV